MCLRPLVEVEGWLPEYALFVKALRFHLYDLFVQRVEARSRFA